MYIKFILSFLLLVALNFNVSFAQDNSGYEDDFSKAIDAEEKRSKWGTEEYKLELIKEMSSANVSLFVDEHLQTINEPSRIYYKFEKFFYLVENFVKVYYLNSVFEDLVEIVSFLY